MALTDPFVLPRDIILTPVATLPAALRERLNCEDGDYTLTHPRARTSSRIVDGQTAALLEELRHPTTIVEAIIRYSQAAGADPQETLVAAYPVIVRFIQAGLLVPADSEEARQIAPSFPVDGTVAGFIILRVIQVLADTELYQVRGAAGSAAALKIARMDAGRAGPLMVAREVAILHDLDGRVNPAFLASGTLDGRPYLVTKWCPGVAANARADALRAQPSSNARAQILQLCCAILDAYAHLHAQGVIHGDVHPHNIIVADDGTITILDYGVACMDGAGSPLAPPPRAGVGFFFEPEYAETRATPHPAQASMVGEQYSLAALVYHLLTGRYYLDFSLEENEMMRQITEDTPLPFVRYGIRPWPAVEFTLRKALSKNPSDRFSSVMDFAGQLRAIAAQEVRDLQAREVAAAGSALPLVTLLDETLQRLGFAGPLLPDGLVRAPTASIVSGAAGIAYALYRIACLHEDAGLLSLADVWVSKAARDLTKATAFYNDVLDITPEIVGPISVYHTASGVHCVQCLISQALGDGVSQEAAIGAFITASQAPCKQLDLTLGRAGTLLACSLLLDSVGEQPARSRQLLRDFGDTVLHEIWAEIDGYAPIQECAAFTYLGMAHGWAGVLYATLCWGESAGAARPVAYEERLEQLAACGESLGSGVRWRRQWLPALREPGSDYVPSWCNGSAGFVFLWTLAHRVFGRAQYLDLAKKSGWNAWEDPNPIGDLCCGLGGRAYALLNLYKHTGELAWLDRARSLAARAPAGIQTWSLLDDSLYKGAIGIALLAADLDRPETACMPFFEPEGWPGRAGATSDGAQNLASQ
jgi:eukaryotic-like serine/threonine-protein kinase